MCDGRPDQRPHRAFIDVVNKLHHRRAKLFGGNRHIVNLPASLVPDVVLIDLVASRTLAGTTTEGQQLLVRCPDQMFAKRCALGEGLLCVPECARVKIGLDIVVARFPVGIGTARVFFGLQAVQLLDG